ncbi:monovalent cation/H(+) antiporter subunit G [Alcaligenes endophyticus]|uniref:Monovalent cation/H(+) antiporter subunit G n=1 Tax=Alcaligenes endophyticus TaxID=1929088 RepID=A0ABT8EL58_9BURK|nr:monovalent cation/H(+) antiporter subunit G [Alcaligenes endophyticus]MCX5590613.1 monovalent cation/H(+) antiporter subunit G [Alcaligenes endophyticus]MDN4122023.1 monovalent cation/H(+) antiporter subunit G [Alcaligenes endophyticus]
MSNLPWWIALPVAVLLVLSGIISLVGSLGLLRLRHFYSRIHAPTLGNTLGVFCMLMSIIILSSFLFSRPILHPLIISILLIITSPVTAIFLMRAAIKRELRQRLAEYAPDEPGYMSVPSKHPVQGAPLHPDE